jgi:hypothetical protein
MRDVARSFKLGGGEEFQCESYKIDHRIFGSGLAFVLAYALLATNSFEE